MSAVSSQTRVGWCPGALRPMASGDGLIVRVKPRCGTLTSKQGIGLAAAADRFGNGALDLTSRANLQIRGVRDPALADLTAALDGLDLLDVSPEAEARRNVVVSPLAGLDPSAAFDIRPVVAALEERLAAEASLGELPGKFGFAVSDGGGLPLDGVPADVRFEAVLDESRGPAFEIRLEGDEDSLATCDAAAIPEMAVRLARAFLGTRRDPDLRRMRDLVARDGASALFGHAGLAAAIRRAHERSLDNAFVGQSIVVASAAEQPGPSGPRPKASRALGVAAPFGRLDATQLAVLAAGAGAAELRLTPWRAILVPGLDGPAAAALAESCAAAGLIVDRADPRLRVATCAGAPGCRRGTTSTLDHAARWARLVGAGQGIVLHVSGCAKSCAHTGPAPLTLVARDGRYDVVVEGRSGDAPAVLGLDGDEAGRLIRTALRDARP